MMVQMMPTPLVKGAILKNLAIAGVVHYSRGSLGMAKGCLVNFGRPTANPPFSKRGIGEYDA